MIDKEEMKLEAIRRLEMLDIHAETIRQFKEENLLSYSIAGVNYWFSDKQKKLISEFEKEQNCLVYYGILNQINLEPTLSLLYVPSYNDDFSYKQEWLLDRQDISESRCLAYVHHIENEILSEIGYINFKCLHGGLQRIF